MGDSSKFGGDGVDKEGAFTGEAEVGRGLFDEVGDGGEVGFGADVFEWQTFGSAELEGDTFEPPGVVVEDFNVILGVADGVDALAVVDGVAHVLVSGAVES